METVIQRLATFPRMFFGFLATATGAVATNQELAALPPDAAPEIHWLPLMVGASTILAGIGTFSLCVLRWVVEYRKARKDQVL